MRRLIVCIVATIFSSAVSAEGNCDEATQNSDLIACAMRDLKTEKLKFSTAIKQLALNSSISRSDRIFLKSRYVLLAKESENICKKIHADGHLSDMYSNACAASQYKSLATMAKGIACENRQDSDYCQE